MTNQTERAPYTIPPLFRRVKAQNLLSFGDEGIDLELGTLNVLIGPNGSGKSNFLEIFSLLKAAPTQLAAPVRAGGGVQEWLWKGRPFVNASIESTIAPFWGSESTKHKLSFTRFEQIFFLVDEVIETHAEPSGTSPPRSDYTFNGGSPELLEHKSGTTIGIERSDIKIDESILSQRKDPSQFPALNLLSFFYDQIRLYREWAFGSGTVLRQPQSIDVLPTPLAENYSNLWMFLSKLRQKPSTKSALVEKIKDIYDGASDFELNFDGGTVQLYLAEGDYTISASRLSDGSLRYLCLLAVLLDPSPPPFMAIEEPERGMHPDLIPKIADMLIDASMRTQLIVTTHSEILVDALHDRPEAIVVCEKRDGQTTMERLDPSKLKVWLKDYRLGDMWTSGQLGGVRW